MSFILLPAAHAGRLPAERRTLDRQAFRVAILLVAVAALNAVDLAYTLFADRIGMLNEMNPIADSFLQAGLRPSLICFKILMLLSGMWLIWKSRRSCLAIPACWVLVMAYAGLAVIWYFWAQTIASPGGTYLVSSLPH